MYISKALYDFMFSKLEIEYSGCHNSDPKNPLWGRRAYFRISLNGTYYNKVTVPVTVLEPTKKQLNSLLKKELLKRINEIGLMLDVDGYSHCRIIEVDPYSVKRLVHDFFENKYLDIDYKEWYRSL